MSTRLTPFNQSFSFHLFRSWQVRIPFIGLILLSLHFTAAAQTLSFKPVTDTVENSTPVWQWVKPATGRGADRANGVATDAAGNVYTVGSFSGAALFGATTLTSKGATDAFLTKHDAAGNVLWVKQAGGVSADQASHVTVDARGNINVAGTFTGTATIGSASFTSRGQADIFIAQYTPTGEMLWAEAAGGLGQNTVSAFDTDAAGNVYLAGTFAANLTIGTQRVSGNSMFIAKLNAAGQAVWAKNSGGTTGTTNGVAFDGAGNAYVTGQFDSTTVIGDITLPYGGGEYGVNVFIAKYDAAGNVPWAKQSTAQAYEGAYGSDIVVDAAGAIYVAGVFWFNLAIDGTTLKGRGESNAFLLRYNGAGELQWARAYSGDAMRIEGLNTDAAGNIYLAHSELYGSGEAHRAYLLQKRDAAGNLLWQKDHSFNLNHDKKIRKVFTDATGHTYVTEGRTYLYTTIYNTFGNVITPQNRIDVTGVTTGSGGQIYVVGNFKGTALFGDRNLTSKGSTDAFLAEIKYTDAYLPRIAVSGNGPNGIATADFNGDSIPDIITGDYDNETVSVLLGKGNGAVATEIKTAISGKPSSIITADFNQDGKVDIAGLNNDTLVIALGDGTGSFTKSYRWATNQTKY